MQKKLLANAWQSYATRVLSPQASNNQRIETRRAFYAGAQAFFSAVMEALDPSPKVMDSDVAAIGSMDQELQAFANDVKEGRA
jgi:hypothetical protein